jgi:hypothetical protein
VANHGQVEETLAANLQQMKIRLQGTPGMLLVARASKVSTACDSILTMRKTPK